MIDAIAVLADRVQSLEIRIALMSNSVIEGDNELFRRIEALERLVADYQDAVMESDKFDERLTALEQRVVYGPPKSRRKKADDD